MWESLSGCRKHLARHLFLGSNSASDTRNQSDYVIVTKPFQVLTCQTYFDIQVDTSCGPPVDIAAVSVDSRTSDVSRTSTTGASGHNAAIGWCFDGFLAVMHSNSLKQETCFT